MFFEFDSSCFPKSMTVGSTVLLLEGPFVGCGVSKVSGLASIQNKLQNKY